jgi:hypothetical protein
VALFLLRLYDIVMTTVPSVNIQIRLRVDFMCVRVLNY